jgi:hypothetical protein
MNKTSTVERFSTIRFSSRMFYNIPLYYFCLSVFLFFCPSSIIFQMLLLPFKLDLQLFIPYFHYIF